VSKVNLVVGLVLGLIAVFLVNSHISGIKRASVSAPFFILAPNASLAKGEKIDETHLVVQRFPEQFNSLTNLAIPANADTKSWIIGRSVSSDIEPNSVLLHSHFLDVPEDRFASKIEQGKRAFSMSTNSATAVSYFIEPGSRVDIIGTFQIDDIAAAGVGAIGIPSRSKETRSLLQNIKVLAVDRVTTRSGYVDAANSGFSTLTLEVSPLEAETLVFAQSESVGPLSFVLRNPNDDKIEPTINISWAALEGKE